MKRINIFVVATIATLIMFANLLYAQPKLEVVGGTTYDWGSINAAVNPLKADIKIRNAGNKTLEITNVKAACGCTTAPIEKNKLEPGETTLLKVTLNTGGFTGSTIKTINISSNDPNTPTETLYLKCNIIRPLVITPNTFISFPSLQVGYEAIGKVVIENTTKEDIALFDIKIEPNNMSINFASKQVVKAGQKVELIAKVKPTTQGRFQSQIRMKTSNKEYPELIIQAYGNVRPSPLFQSN